MFAFDELLFLFCDAGLLIFCACMCMFVCACARLSANVIFLMTLLHVLDFILYFPCLTFFVFSTVLACTVCSVEGLGQRSCIHQQCQYWALLGNWPSADTLCACPTATKWNKLSKSANCLLLLRWNRQPTLLPSYFVLEALCNHQLQHNSCQWASMFEL